jgi:hypothetical protein
MKTKNKELVAVRLRSEQVRELAARVKKNPETNVSSIIRQALDAFFKS